MLRSWGPVTLVTPRVPTTCAWTIRGETARWRALIFLKWPFTSRPSFACACFKLRLNGPQRCLGEEVSYGSSTPLSHGSGCVPMNEFSMSSVSPPEVEKKYVVTGWPW